MFQELDDKKSYAVDYGKNGVSKECVISSRLIVIHLKLCNKRHTNQEKLQCQVFFALNIPYVYEEREKKTCHSFVHRIQKRFLKLIAYPVAHGFVVKTIGLE